jgi:uncharacterized membrane protein
MSATSLAASSLRLRPTSNERLAAIVAHAGTLFAWFLVPLVVFLVMPHEARWARYHALQSLLWSLLGTLLGLVTFGLAVPVFLVWHVIAAVKMMRDGDYEYPLVGEGAHHAIYDA